MWRGDGRSGIAVAAPFGWRCPMSQTLAPSLIEPDMQISRIRLSDKTHAFAHGGLLPTPVRRTSRKCP